MQLYVYSALITGVYDGDSITCDIDLGLDIIIKDQKIRLQDINAPEIRGDQRKRGLESRDWLRNRILGQQVIINTARDKKGKYGRYIATIFFEGENINLSMVKLGLARWYKNRHIKTTTERRKISIIEPNKTDKKENDS